MQTFESLKGKLLIASPQIKDPYFDHSLVYLYEHNEYETVGFILNKPSSTMLGEILDEVEIETNFSLIKNYPVLLGGPMQKNQTFMLYPIDERKVKHFETSQKTDRSFEILASREDFSEFAKSTPPKNTFFFLGYSAWESKQLEKEIKHNDWFFADPFDDIFHLPYEARWEAAIKSIGVDINKLMGITGHD